MEGAIRRRNPQSFVRAVNDRLARDAHAYVYGGDDAATANRREQVAWTAASATATRQPTRTLSTISTNTAWLSILRRDNYNGSEGTLKFTEAMIAWTPGTDRLAVGPWPDSTRWSHAYLFTTGACLAEMHRLHPDARQRC